MEKLMLPAAEAAILVGVKRSTFYSLHSEGLLPGPIRLRGRVLWRVDDLKSWVAAGCPNRQAFDALQKN